MAEKNRKKTSIGDLPSDWETVRLEGNIGTVKSGKRLPKGYLVTDNVTAHPYIRVIDMQMGGLDTSDIKYVPEEAFDAIKAYRIFKDDIYISVAGTLGLVGRIPAYLDGANLTENANRITNITCNIDFLKYWLMSEYTQKSIVAAQTLGAQPKLAVYQIRNFIIPRPSLPEQEAIVDALQDIENLIKRYEKLLIKKRNIKRGAMQELLSGKKRLPGYTKAWEKINLSKNFTLKARIGWQGLTTEEYLEHGDAYLITGTDFCKGRIKWDTCHYVNNDRYDQDKNIQIVNGDVLMSKDGTIGKVAYVTGLNKKATLNSGVFLIRSKYPEKYSGGFVYHVLSSEIFKMFLDKLSAGSTINHLYQKDFVKFDFYVPSDINEQLDIEECLNSMDEEIAVLEKKLLKYKNIYRGMMQELLMGRIRII